MWYDNIELGSRSSFGARLRTVHLLRGKDTTTAAGYSAPVEISDDQQYLLYCSCIHTLFCIKGVHINIVEHAPRLHTHNMHTRIPSTTTRLCWLFCNTIFSFVLFPLEKSFPRSKRSPQTQVYFNPESTDS